LYKEDIPREKRRKNSSKLMMEFFIGAHPQIWSSYQVILVCVRDKEDMEQEPSRIRSKS
jgi:hypothetical protein